MLCLLYFFAGANRELVLATQRRIASIEALESEHLAKQIARAAEWRRMAAEGALAVLEAERQLAEERARWEGGSAAGLEEFHRERRRLIEEGVAAELRGLDEVTRAEARHLRARIAAAAGPERIQLERELTALLEEEMFKRQQIEDRARLRRLGLDRQEFEEREAQWQREIQRETQRFRHRLAMGQATIKEELEFLRLATMDSRRSAQEREEMAVQLRQRTKAIEQQEFEFRRLLGEASLEDEVERQAQLVAATKKGTQERFDAEKQLVEKLNQLRQQRIEAKRRAEGGEPGLEEPPARTKAESFVQWDQTTEALEAYKTSLAEYKEQLREINELERVFQLRFPGPKETPGLQEKINRMEQSATQAVGSLLPPPAEAQGQGVLPELTKPDVGPIIGAFSAAFQSIATEADTFLSEFHEKIQSGASQIGDSLFETFMDRVVRRLEDEAKRL